jgi:membrane protease YdiL (CAAX protease family)
MTVSLILFLNICLIVTSAFPWAQSYSYMKKNITMEKFGRSFLSTFIFILIFMYFLYPDFYTSFINPFACRDMIFIIVSVLGAIVFENLIFKFKYKKCFLIKIPQNFYLLIFIGFLIPIAEEILFRGILKYLFDIYAFPKVLYICISSICFGLNHMIYGYINIITKTFWGIFFAFSYCLTGNLLISIIAHIMINLIYVVIAKRKRNYA